MSGASTASPCVLLVEDEVMVSMMLEDILAMAGYRVRVASGVAEALATLRDETVDVAVLDVNLRGEDSYPVADLLRERGIPFTFASGYGADGVSASYRREPMLQKPYEAQALRDSLARLLGRR